MKKSAVVLMGIALGCLLVFAGSAWAGVCDDPVSTAQGPVIGRESPEGPACAYKGIPYAAPPVGELRWKPPQEPPAREEALEAFEFGPRCISKGAGSEVPANTLPPASEDCLYLNIWRPEKSGVFPVMVWIHGGSLEVGTAAEPLYWADRLAARQDVVVVSINYRLNYYGFLAHPALSREDPHHSSGNYGLLDQVAALRWVKENIMNFSGDPDNVTIFGESAGGWSVCNLLACPLAKGLFQKAVIESGGCEVVKSLEEGEEDGERFAKAMGCEGPEAATCMRSKSPKELEAALAAMKKEEKKSKKGGILSGLVSMSFTWVPKIDGWALKEKPLDALKSGRWNQVPLMVGSNRDEVKLFTLMMPGLRLAAKPLVKKTVAAVVGKENLAEFERLYPWKQYRRPADAALDAFGDMALGCPCFEAAEAASAFQPVYYYRFDYDRHLLPHLAGAAHGMEIPFVFGNLDKPPASWLLTRGQTKKAKPLSDIMMTYWVNFAKTGNPNGGGLPDWPRYNQEERMRIYFDEPVRQGPADNVERCRFWREHGRPLTSPPPASRFK